MDEPKKITMYEIFGTLGVIFLINGFGIFLLPDFAGLFYAFLIIGFVFIAITLATKFFEKRKKS